jgi:hypothetical protein
MTTNTPPLTPAGHRYVAGIYEQLVDAGMHLGQIQGALARKGITRTPGQIEYDLETRYGFAGYCARHPATPRLTFAQLDAIEEAKVTKTASRAYAEAKASRQSKQSNRVVPG